MSTYDVSKVNVVINYSGGQTYLTGFANGTNIAAERDSDSMAAHKGLKGDVSFSKTNDNSGKITFSLKHDSPDNKLMNQLTSSVEQFQCQVIDGNDDGKVECGGSNCVVLRPANLTRGAEIGAQEWSVYVPNLAFNYK